MNNDTPFVKRAYNLGLKAVPNFVQSLTPKQVEYYENHLDQIPDALKRGFALPNEPFGEAIFKCVDAFDLVVPDWYDHATQLCTAKKRYGKALYDYDDNLNDNNFSKVTNRLKRGQKLKVFIWDSNMAITTFNEQMAFLRSQGSIFTGAQGLSIVVAQKREKLARGYRYISLDEKRALWKHAGTYCVPCVNVDPDENELIFGFSLNCCDVDATSDIRLLSFTNISE